MMTNARKGQGSNYVRIGGWTLAALVLLIPAVAMQFTREVAWDWKDFVFAGVMVGVVGLLLELAARATSNGSYRFGVGVAVMAGFLLVWVNAAVGIIGDEDNLHNLMFLALLLVPALGAILARFRPDGMFRAMTATAIGQAGIGAVALVLGHSILMMTAAWVAMWLCSAALFRRAAGQIVTS